jgi:hypothetical protein
MMAPISAFTVLGCSQTGCAFVVKLHTSLELVSRPSLASTFQKLVTP